MARLASAALVLAMAPATVSAQQRPAITEDPVPVGSGQVLGDVGVEFGHDVTFPASGLAGDLWRVGVFSARAGLSSIAELQVGGTAWQTLAISSRQPGMLAPAVEATGDRTSGGGDVVVATKVRVVAETAGRPAFGLRFATKLPVASDGSGLSLDTTDFHATLLVGKTWRGVRVVGNVGLGILADPTRADRQNDVLLYGLSVARAMAARMTLVADVYGRASVRSAADTPPGTESAGTARLGLRWRIGRGQVDAAVVVGLARPDPEVGLAAGYSLQVPAFRVP